MSVEPGQVLWMKIRFNNSGDVSATAHPYLVLDKNPDLNTVEVGQLDSIAGKEYKATFRCNKPIYNSDPTETVIFKDSFLQMDNKILLEDHLNLTSFRRTEDKLSTAKFQEALSAYREYQNDHHISENKTVYLSQDELDELNR